MSNRSVCPKCAGKGFIQDEKGVRTCFDCLLSGNLDQHDSNLKQANIKV